MTKDGRWKQFILRGPVLYGSARSKKKPESPYPSPGTRMARIQVDVLLGPWLLNEPANHWPPLVAPGRILPSSAARGAQRALARDSGRSLRGSGRTSAPAPAARNGSNSTAWTTSSEYLVECKPNQRKPAMQELIQNFEYIVCVNRVKNTGEKGSM
jgi:hypothetical protein